MSQTLFALDIGTRSVVGIILEETDGRFHVVDMVMKEHQERAMVDGQIHNVIYVAQLIKEITTALEQKYGTLQKVSVAAAGRSLKTEQAEATMPIRHRAIFTEEDMNRLELQAVQQAQQQLVQAQGEHQTHFYCVGYSVLHYKLDGEIIGSLLDQQGDFAAVEVIATFLPRVVVESLIAALQRADLEMGALTLEPIAAINVLIPPSMRRLNVALVDIGAGTSDIAITDKNTVVAYGMVPIAGDEITEALSDHYLLDFPVAEQVKRQIVTAQPIVIQDILGFDETYEHEAVCQTILPAVQELANAIGTEILRLNNNEAPKAVMLVGGGSLTPKLTETLSAVLQLPTNRIAVRNVEAIQNITRADHISTTPELVTPIGIAIAAQKMPIQYMSVTVNEQVIRLFELKEMTVGDALLAANIKAKQLFGKPGQALAVTVNGQDIFIPGEHGTPAEILVNGTLASTKTIIHSKDVITVAEGLDGKPATATVGEVIDYTGHKQITINQEKYDIAPTIVVNKQIVNIDYILHDRDQITVETADTIEQVLQLTNYEQVITQLKPFQIYVNQKVIQIPQASVMLLLNGKPAKLTYHVQHGDSITWQQPQKVTVQEVANEASLVLQHEITVTFQGEQLVLCKTVHQAMMQQQFVEPSHIVSNGATITFIPRDSSPWIFQDVFRFSDWQLPTETTSHFEILRNQQPARFDSPIFGGDELQIIFK